MKRFFLYSAVILLFNTSCQKINNGNDSSQVLAEPNPQEYYPLSVGSYWIYSLHKIDSSGTITNMQQEDSIYISATREINGHIYSSFKTHNIDFIPCTNYSKDQRDSSGYLLSGNGDVWFAPNDYSDPLHRFIHRPNGTDTLYIMTSKMVKPKGKVSVPAGTFSTLVLEKSYEIYEPRYGDFRQFVIHRARNVGIVSFTCGNLHDPATYEFRLERYHIN